MCLHASTHVDFGHGQEGRVGVIVLWFDKEKNENKSKRFENIEYYDVPFSMQTSTKGTSGDVCNTWRGGHVPAGSSPGWLGRLSTGRISGGIPVLSWVKS